MDGYIRRWGKGAAVRIPAAILEAAGLKPGNLVDVRAEAGRIVIESAARKKVTLDELIAGITPESLHGETDWGEPRGKEIW